MSIIRTTKRRAPAFSIPNPTHPRIGSGGKLLPQFSARDPIRSSILVGDQRYSTTTTSTSVVNFNPYQFTQSSSFSYDADYKHNYATPDHLAIIVGRTPGDASLNISGADSLPFSGIDSGGSTNSFHRLWVAIGRNANPTASISPCQFQRIGGSSGTTITSVYVTGVAMDRVPGMNYATSVISTAVTQFTFPAFQPKNGNSLLLYIASQHNGAGGSPYFSGWNAPGLTRAGGTSTSYTHGYQEGSNNATYGAVTITPFRIDSQAADEIPPVTCNVSSLNTGIVAIVELEPALDYDLL